MKNLLINYLPAEISKMSLVESKNLPNGQSIIKLRGKLQEAEQKNGNGRVYPREVLLREVDKYIKGPVKSRTALGELDHPESSVINLSNASHIVVKAWWDGDDLMGELELLNTPSGKIAQEIIKQGIPLGISSRGMGSVKQIGESVEVQDDFELLTFDLVSVPSTPNAYMRQVNEGKQYQTYKYAQVDNTITDLLCSLTGICALCPDKN